MITLGRAVSCISRLMCPHDHLGVTGCLYVPINLAAGMESQRVRDVLPLSLIGGTFRQAQVLEKHPVVSF